MSDSNALGLASTAIGIVNGTIGLLKEAREAAKRSDDHDLKDKLSDVFDSVLELKDVVGNLREENAELRKRLEAKANLKWDTRSKLYFADDDADPFCPVCLDKEGRQMRLHPVFHASSGSLFRYDCKACTAHFMQN